MICPQCGYSENQKTRTIQQNRAHFGLGIARLAEHLGYDKEDMHKVLAGEFFGYSEVNIGGKIVIVPKSTKNRSTVEFSRFFEFVQRVGAENGIDIPSPGEGIPVGY